MTTPSELPDPGLILHLITAFRESKVMFAAVQLGVFDLVAENAKTLAELASALDANADALERLLDACSGLGLLTKSPSGYTASPAAAAYLVSTSPHRLNGYINYSNELLWRLWAGLEGAVLEGTHRWKAQFGSDGPIFSHFFRDEKAKYEFLMGMHGQGMISSPQVVRAFDLSGFKTLVDLGGATGHLATEACKVHPGLAAIVFDLPEVKAIGMGLISKTPVADRVRFVAGDFFEDPLPEADLFAVGRILHDWSEAKIAKLLDKIYQALPQNGALLIAEKLLDADKSGPKWALLQSLGMLVCTEGKEPHARGVSSTPRARRLHEDRGRNHPHSARRHSRANSES